MSEGGPAPTIRVDKWLWQARFFKSRTLAAALVSAGKLRIDGARCEKPAKGVQVGDTLTFPQGNRVRVVRLLALGTRRGPATEAQALYDDLSPPAPSKENQPERVGPRPTKRARRDLTSIVNGYRGNEAD